MGFDEFGGHGVGVIEHGQGGAGIALHLIAAGIQYGLGSFLDGFARLVREPLWPGKVVVNDVDGIAVTTFQASSHGAHPGVVLGAAQNAEMP